MLKIKAIRKRLKVEEKDVCEHLGIELKVLEEIESGKVLPDKEMKSKLSDFYNSKGVKVGDGDFDSEVIYRDFQLSIKKYKGNKVLYLGKEYDSLSALAREYGVSRSAVTRWFGDSTRVNSKLEVQINGKVYKKSYLEDLAQKHGLKYSVVHSRLKNNMPLVNVKRGRKEKLFDFHGKSLTLKEISEITGIKRDTLLQRSRNGIPLDAPVQSGGRKKDKYEFEGKVYTLKELAKELNLPIRVLQARIVQDTDLRAPYYPRTPRYYYKDEWLSIKEIEKLTGFSTEKVQEMVENGEIDSGI